MPRHLMVVIATAALLAPTAAAQWINPAGGDFGDSANWSGGVVPGPGASVVFNLPATYTVTGLAGRQIGPLQVTAGDVTFVNTGTFRLHSFNLSAAVRLQGGAYEVTGGSFTSSTINCAPFIAEHITMTNFDEVSQLRQSLTVSGVAQLTDSVVQMRSVSLSGEIDGGRFYAYFGGCGNGTFRNMVLSAGEQGFVGGTLINSSFSSSEGSAGSATLYGSSLTGIRRVTGSLDCRAQSTVSGGGWTPTLNGELLLRDGSRFQSSLDVISTSQLRVEAGSLGAGSLFVYPGPQMAFTFVLDGMRPRSLPALYVDHLDGPLAGRLSLEVQNPNAVRVGDETVLFTRQSAFTSNFPTIVVPTLGGGRVLQVALDGPRIVARVVTGGNPCWSADFDGDGQPAADADIAAFFACLAGFCCPLCAPADFNSDGDTGTDQDIEAFFRVLAGGSC
jgi:hypothetical protein